jgi:HlyD family secretion protein
MPGPKKKTRRKIIVWGGIAIVLVAVSVYAVFFRNRQNPITVQSEKVLRRNLTEIVTANGKLQPVVYVKISPEVSGEIIDLPVKEGQQITKGDLLMKIKPDFYQANRNSVEASLKSSLAHNDLAAANLERAEAEFKRIGDLYANKLVSESQFLDAKTGFDGAKASGQQSEHQTSMARASLARADEELRKTTIYSPLSGTISKLNSQLGERVVGTATYQGTEVMTIADLNDMEARVDIGEIDVVLISIGQKASLEVDSFRDRKFSGIVSEIANTAKTQGAGSQQEATKFEVRIRIQEKAAFRPGMSVTAEVETRMRTNVLTVPIQSVTTRMPPKGTNTTNQVSITTNQVSKANKSTNLPASSDSSKATTNVATNASRASASKKPNELPKPIEVVFLVDGQKAKILPVKRGISDDSYVEILEGLQEDQEVVSGGYKAINRELEDGKKIKVDNSKPSQEKTEGREEPAR